MTSTVEELRRALAAVDAGQFAQRPEQRKPRSPWTPAVGEQVLAVVGAHGAAGASTLALAIATVVAPARVIECAPPDRSGLIGAATAELGRRGGWLCGTRDGVVLERWDDDASDNSRIPLATDLTTTVVDVGTQVSQLATDSWPAAIVHGVGPVVIVGSLSLPGIRHIQQTLTALNADGSLVVALRGPKPRPCPRYLRQAVGDLDPSVPLIHVHDDPRLRLRGVDTSPLPTALLAAGRQVVSIAEQTWQKEVS